MLALPERVGAARMRQPTHPILVASVASIVAAVFITDLIIPSGYSIWVLYIAAVGLSIVGLQPLLPPVTAGVAIVLVVTGFLASDEMAAEKVLISINRVSGSIVLATLGGLGWRFVHVRREMARRQWVQGGRSAVQLSMQGDPHLEKLCNELLGALCRYVEAPVGAVHVADGTGWLERQGAVGIPAEAKAPRRHRVGDGLVGRVAAEKQLLQVHDLPEGHLPLVSGLGSSTPRELVLEPLVNDGELVGVIELGLLHRATEEDLELLATVADQVAVEITAAQAQQRTRELLEETQRQAEELQAQQEELEAANAELENHTRALRESQDRLAAQNDELERTTAELEAQNEEAERQRDALSRAQHELEEKASELERASQYKSQFLANMSHELRTPLNSALILARLLADNRQGTLTDEQVQYAETIYAAGNDLLALINDVLDLSRIEAGRFDLRVEPLRVSELLGHLRAEFEPVAAERTLELRLSAREPDLVLQTDRRRLEQVLRNLLANALKFTERGYVALEVERRGDRVVFAVRDTGIGIAQDSLEMVFQAFRQADGGTSRKYGGTGLGLAIARDLAARMGGSLWAESEVQKGSTFHLELPMTIDEGSAVAPEAPRARPELQRQREAEPELPPALVPDDRERLEKGARAVLIIEDDVAFARILQDLAREMHFHTLVATSAGEGMELARRFVPAAVILDLALPDHHGLSVLDRLKRAPTLRHIPVHVISATDFTHEALSMGAVGFAIKPVKRDELVEAFRRLSDQLGERPRRVLVVEDDPRQIDAICSLLGSAGVDTIRAGGVGKALELLHEERFDCMVMDLHLEDGTGFELLERMIEGGQGDTPPVIVHTGQDLSREDEDRLRRYSDSIIIKGARSPERLLDEVTLFLHQVESRLPAELQRMLQAARSREAYFEGRNILVVEDDVRNVFALGSILEPKGATLQIARDGIEALEALEKNEAIDLVLMDIMMPRMDGFEAIRRIREKPNLARLPIIALTAKAMPDDQARCLEVGANDYASKPIDVEKLLSLIRVWMPRRERA